MAMRDEKGRFLKRAKEALAGKRPATVSPEEFRDFKQEVLDKEFTEIVSVNVVPNSARQSARRSYNPMSAQITLIGNLTADPELRTTNGGKSVISFALGYTPRKPDGSDGETSFYNVTAWDFLADNFAASFKKGDRLVVIGRVRQNKWNDPETDKVMSRLEITADEIAGSCRWHTVEMSKVAKVTTSVQTEAAPLEEDIFAS